MSYTKPELIQYRVNRSEESLEEAKLLASDNHWNSAVNRLYYACYYLISALLVKHNLNTKTHSGAKVLFNKHFIKEGKVEKKQGRFFSELFDKRQESDYQDFQQFNENDVLPLIARTENFMRSIKKLL